MTTYMNRRPGYGQSFTLPLVGPFLRSLALTSCHVLDVEQRVRSQARGLGGEWSLVVSLALPMDPEEHETGLQPGISVQRGYEATSHAASSIRSGTVTLRGSCGLEAKLGFSAEGEPIFAEGQALAVALQEFILAYIERAKSEETGDEPVRMIYRNLDRAEAWIVEPQPLRFGRGAQSPIAYEYTLTFQILGKRESDPRPSWLGALETWILNKGAVLTGLGMVAAAAAIAREAGLYAGAALNSVFRDPLILAGNGLRDLGEGIGTAWQAPVEAFRDGTTAAEGLEGAWRDALNAAAGRSPAAGVDPESDPDRVAFTAGNLEAALSIADAADTLALAAGSAYAVQEPALASVYAIGRSDDAGTVAAAAGLTAEQFAEMLGNGPAPAVDPTGMIPGTLVPGAGVPVGGGAATAAESSGGQAGLLAGALAEDLLYGVNLLLADRDLVPEAETTEPQDVRVVSGFANLVQGCEITLATARGTNRAFPGLGIDAPVGEPNHDAARVPVRVVEALLEDDRVRRVRLDSARVDGDRVEVTPRVEGWTANALELVHRG